MASLFYAPPLGRFRSMRDRMTGDRDAHLTTLLGRKLAGAVGGATFTPLQEYGHYLHEERPKLAHDTTMASMTSAEA